MKTLTFASQSKPLIWKKQPFVFRDRFRGNFIWPPCLGFELLIRSLQTSFQSQHGGSINTTVMLYLIAVSTLRTFDLPCFHSHHFNANCTEEKTPQLKCAYPSMLVNPLPLLHVTFSSASIPIFREVVIWAACWSKKTHRLVETPVKHLVYETWGEYNLCSDGALGTATARHDAWYPTNL